jgi:hypothetical protein
VLAAILLAMANPDGLASSGDSPPAGRDDAALTLRTAPAPGGLAQRRRQLVEDGRLRFQQCQ